MKIRLIALCAAASLLAAACGSRLGDDELSAAAGSGGGPAVEAPNGNGTGTTVPGGDQGPMFGSLPAPCGPAPDGAGEIAASTGVTQDTLKIGVISDKGGAVRVPTASIEESVRAFVGWCNDLGGINGRTLELKTYDAELVAGDIAAKAACNDGLLALVGTGVVQDDKMAATLDDCGLVNVAAYTATQKAATAKLTVVALPNDANRFPVAAGKWLSSQHPEASKNAAMLAVDYPVGQIQGDRTVNALEGAAGFDFTYRAATPVLPSTFSGEVAEMKKAGTEWVMMVSTTQHVVMLIRDLRNAGMDPVLDLGQQYYDQELLDEPLAEGAYVQVNTLPLEDADEVPVVQQFFDIYGAIDTPQAPTSLGMQAFSSSLLFAQAASTAGDGLNRETLLAELNKIEEWDGGGLHNVSNPAKRTVQGCFIYMRVSGGKFVREMPKEAGTFECPEPEADQWFVESGS